MGFLDRSEKIGETRGGPYVDAMRTPRMSTSGGVDRGSILSGILESIGSQGT